MKDMQHLNKCKRLLTDAHDDSKDVSEVYDSNGSIMKIEPCDSTIRKLLSLRSLRIQLYCMLSNPAKLSSAQQSEIVRIIQLFQSRTIIEESGELKDKLATQVSTELMKVMKQDLQRKQSYETLRESSFNTPKKKMYASASHHYHHPSKQPTLFIDTSSVTYIELHRNIITSLCHHMESTLPKVLTISNEFIKTSLQHILSLRYNNTNTISKNKLISEPVELTSSSSSSSNDSQEKRRRRSKRMKNNLRNDKFEDNETDSSKHTKFNSIEFLLELCHSPLFGQGFIQRLVQFAESSTITIILKKKPLVVTLSSSSSSSSSSPSPSPSTPIPSTSPPTSSSSSTAKQSKMMTTVRTHINVPLEVWKHILSYCSLDWIQHMILVSYAWNHILHRSLHASIHTFSITPTPILAILNSYHHYFHIQQYTQSTNFIKSNLLTLSSCHSDSSSGESSIVSLIPTPIVFSGTRIARLDVLARTRLFQSWYSANNDSEEYKIKLIKGYDYWHPQLCEVYKKYEHIDDLDDFHHPSHICSFRKQVAPNLQCMVMTNRYPPTYIKHIFNPPLECIMIAGMSFLDAIRGHSRRVIQSKWLLMYHQIDRNMPLYDDNVIDNVDNDNKGNNDNEDNIDDGVDHNIDQTTKESKRGESKLESKLESHDNHEIIDVDDDEDEDEDDDIDNEIIKLPISYCLSSYLHLVVHLPNIMKDALQVYRYNRSYGSDYSYQLLDIGVLIENTAKMVREYIDNIPNIHGVMISFGCMKSDWFVYEKLWQGARHSDASQHHITNKRVKSDQYGIIRGAPSVRRKQEFIIKIPHDLAMLGSNDTDSITWIPQWSWTTIAEMFDKKLTNNNNDNSNINDLDHDDDNDDNDHDLHNTRSKRKNTRKTTNTKKTPPIKRHVPVHFELFCLKAEPSRCEFSSRPVSQDAPGFCKYKRDHNIPIDRRDQFKSSEMFSSVVTQENFGWASQTAIEERALQQERWRRIYYHNSQVDKYLGTECDGTLPPSLDVEETKETKGSSSDDSKINNTNTYMNYFTEGIVNVRANIEPYLKKRHKNEVSRAEDDKQLRDKQIEAANRPRRSCKSKYASVIQSVEPITTTTTSPHTMSSLLIPSLTSTSTSNSPRTRQSNKRRRSYSDTTVYDHENNLESPEEDAYDENTIMDETFEGDVEGDDDDDDNDTETTSSETEQSSDEDNDDDDDNNNDDSLETSD